MIRIGEQQVFCNIAMSCNYKRKITSYIIGKYIKIQNEITIFLKARIYVLSFNLLLLQLIFLCTSLARACAFLHR